MPPSCNFGRTAHTISPNISLDNIVMAIHMTVEQLLNIEDALVSDDHPARDDGTFDYERCTRLHNYLVAYARMVRHGRDTPDLDALARQKRFFSEKNQIEMHTVNAWTRRLALS